ncbi:MAG TPA: penicillin-binding protein 2 [Thermoleophilaceae bacterium]|nr:penicillin-binding protein 2 [Thermoleophilaceae bacterium]
MRLVERRIGLLFALFLVLLAAATLRASWLGTVRAGSLKKRALTQQVEQLDVPARRGTISDRHGMELAVSEDAATVFANPFLIKNPARASARLAPLLHLPRSVLLEKLSDRRKGFVYLRRQMEAGAGDRVEKLKIEGIGMVLEPRRTYPQGALASQVIGSVGTDGYGLSGLEQSRNSTLRGENGRRRLVKDAFGEPVSMVEVQRARAGHDMRLTLDAALQGRAEAVLSEIGRTNRPRGATALVMDPRTGELLALANWPRVDANDVGGAPAYARQDRAVAASYEPGSTFKAFTASGALAERLITPGTAFDLPPSIRVADRVIGEAHGRGSLRLTVANILAQSSNVGSVMIGLKLGARRFDRWVRRFGFGRPTGIDLPGEAPGIVLPLGDYSGSSMGNMPIGQGLAVTPIQMAQAYSAIARDGVMRTPYVLGGDRRPGKRVLPRKVARQVSRMLEGVLGPGGTATEARVPGYRLAGKTGTAEKPDGHGGYSKTKFVASFIGYAPARDPRLLIAVMVDEPKGQIYGGVVAAPAFEKIMAFALPYLRIPPG